MIELKRADRNEEPWLRMRVIDHHYLHAWPDSRCRVYPYAVRLVLPDGRRQLAGVLAFGRQESTRCYEGELTYGSLDDVATGRAQYSRWELLCLARVWLAPWVQAGGEFYDPALLPGYIDRKGQFRSTLASHVIELALDRIVVDYLMERPPCFLEEPWKIREVISYCDTKRHKGTIYKAAGFRLVRTNEEGVETWAKAVRPLTLWEALQVRKRSQQSPRSREYRSERAAGPIAQLALDV